MKVSPKTRSTLVIGILALAAIAFAVSAMQFEKSTAHTAKHRSHTVLANGMQP